MPYLEITAWMDAIYARGACMFFLLSLVHALHREAGREYKRRAAKSRFHPAELIGLQYWGWSGNRATADYYVLSRRRNLTKTYR